MLVFDTLSYAKRLTEVGVPEEQAQVQAEIQLETLTEIAEKELVTKKDLRQEITAVKEELRQEIQQLEVKMYENNVMIIKWIVGMGLTIVLSNIAVSFAIVGIFSR